MICSASGTYSLPWPHEVDLRVYVPENDAGHVFSVKPGLNSVRAGRPGQSDVGPAADAAARGAPSPRVDGTKGSSP